ncbi:MAG TPA: COX15/CtaA family protein [Bacillota bacterium]
MNTRAAFRWAAASVVLAYALILLGGLVSATHSGMGCGPQWPLCNDRAVPVFDSRETLLEYLHRVVAGVLIVTTALTALAAWRNPTGRALRASAAVCVLLLVVQALLGAVTVWLDLPPSVSTTHLVISQVYLGALVLTAALAAPRRHAAPALDPHVGPAAALTVGRRALASALAVLSVITLGALLKHHMAGLACGVEWPLCNGAAVPSPLTGFVLLHWSHRTLAYASALLVIATLVAAARHRRQRPDLLRGAVAAALLVMLQITLGVLTVLSRVEPALSVAHLGVATLLWVSLLALTGAAYAPRVGRRFLANPGEPVRVGVGLGDEPAGAR